jgi:hypothetical protein
VNEPPDPLDIAPGAPGVSAAPAVEPVVPGAPAPGADVEPGDAEPGVVDPGDAEPGVVDPAVPVGAIEPAAPAPSPLAMLALVSMKVPLGALVLPAVPVAPVVAALDAVLPAPLPDTRHPVTTTVCPCDVLPLVAPACPGVPLVVCAAAAPAPSATAIIVPKRNCRFIHALRLSSMGALVRGTVRRCHCKRRPRPGPGLLVSKSSIIFPLRSTAALLVCIRGLPVTGRGAARTSRAMHTIARPFGTGLTSS